MGYKESKTDITLTKTPESYWISSTPQTNYSPLDSDITVDAAIIGGGLVGITCAFLLKKEGLRVAVLEADRIGQGTTGHTTAKITSQHNLIYHKIKAQMGEEMARQYAGANESAIHIMESIVKEYKIDCDFCHRPAFCYTQSDQYIQKIMDEAKTASQVGIDAHYIEKTPLPFPVKAAVRFDNQAQFHPRKYLLAIAGKIPGDGSHIFEQTRVVDIEEGNPHIVVTRQGKKVRAQRIIISSHYPCYDGLGFYFAKVYPERSYALGIKIDEPFPEGMYINAESPARSLRSQKAGDSEIVIVAGEHHKTGHGQNMLNHYENLRNFAVSTFNNVQNILYRWSTQDCMTIDGVPYVGHLTSKTPNIYIATGFGKWGMTNSTASAILLKDLIVIGKSPWQDVYNPSRFTPSASAAEFVKQNTDVAVNLISGKLAYLPKETTIKSGEGKAVDIDGNKVGIHRDNKRNIHIVDITCTHMGCELKWNDAEKTWDCPCHGSRFTCEGDIAEGPALNPLNHINQGPNKIDPNIL